MFAGETIILSAERKFCQNHGNVNQHRDDSVRITAIPSTSRQFRQHHGNSVSITAIPSESRQFRQLHGNSGRITAIPSESRRFRQNHGGSVRITAILTESRRFWQNNDFADSKTAKTRKKGVFLPFCQSCEWKTRKYALLLLAVE